jgi:hypothetical protein
MHRTRNIEHWNTTFHNYPTFQDFLRTPDLQPGGHTINHNDRPLDILIEPRNSDATLVVFNAAISLNHTTTPYFTGRKLAKDANINLIAIADPTLYYGELSIAWYLGDTTTGPLRPIISPVLHHIINQLDSTRTILFGASGGGFAAAHLAQDFPDSIALAINPRLSLERQSRSKMAAYLKNAHQTKSNGIITETERALLADYGPTRLKDQVQTGLNHDLLIYQNLLDYEFIEHQLAPFLKNTDGTDRLWLRYAVDKPGHAAIPPDTVRTILMTLATAPNQQAAIQASGFTPSDQTHHHLLEHLPTVGTQMASLHAERHQLITETNSLRHDLDTAWAQLAEAHQTSQQLHQKVEQLEHQNTRLRAEPHLPQRVWRVLPHRIRQKLKLLLHRQ